MPRYQYTAVHPVPQRASLNQSVDVTTEDIKRLPARATKPHWLFFAGIGMFLFIGGYVLWTVVVSPFFTDTYNHWQYGEAQISQYDFTVGHGSGISHFLAQDYHGTVVIVEIVESGKYPTYVYTSQIFASETTNHVVTLAIVDANHDGKPDLEITVSGDTIPVILYNNGSTFQSSSPESK